MGAGGVGESGDGKKETTVLEQQIKKSIWGKQTKNLKKKPFFKIYLFKKKANKI